MVDFDAQMNGWTMDVAPTATAAPSVYAVWTGPTSSALSSSSPAPVASPGLSASTGSLPSLPSRMALRSSASSPVASPLSAGTSSSPMRTQSPVTPEMMAANYPLCEDRMHIVRCNDYARDPQLAPPVEQLVGVDALYAMLDATIGATLVNPTLCPSLVPVMAVQSTPGSGARLAVHLWAARRAPQRLAVLTYSFFDGNTEASVRFHHDLFTLAASLTPCILVIDRIMTRAAAESVVVEAVYNAMAFAWAQRTEHRMTPPGMLPPFWLLFIDEKSPKVVPPGQWQLIQHNVVLDGLTPATVRTYLLCIVRNQVAARLANAADVDGLMAHYEAHIGPFLAAHGTRFGAIGDIVQFVNILFALPLRSRSLLDLRTMTADGAPLSALPGAEHLLPALTEMMQTKTHAHADAAVPAQFQRTSPHPLRSHR